LTSFRRLAERELYRGPLISVANGTFEAPSGERFDRDIVHHPGAVSVVPLLADGRTVVLVRQYRAAVDRELLEIPAGKRDVAGEPPAATAARELEEEIGMRAGRLTKLAEFFNSPGFCDEHSTVFLAHELSEVTASAQGVEEQHMTVERIDLAVIGDLIAAGDLIDAKSIIGLCLARQLLGA
jgi:ADP-ribose pyrophosphatase